MNLLLCLAVVTATSASLVLWQQASIDRVHEDIAGLGREILTLRQSLESDQNDVRHARHQVDQLRQTLRVVRARSEAPAQLDSLLTPAHEGWWPENRPYFYMAKSSLGQVTFGKCRLTVDEVNALLTRRMQSQMSGVTSVQLTPRDENEIDYEFRLFDQNELNSDAAVLLGMTDTERSTVQDLYAGVFREVRRIEAAHAVRVNPPEVVGDSGSDQKIVARLPVLSAETQPLLAELNQRVELVLGASRSGILASLAKDYAVEHLDQLGDQPREFIQTGESLIVGVGGSQLWQPRTLKGESSIGSGGFPSPLDYTHLFGPGAPCELK